MNTTRVPYTTNLSKICFFENIPLSKTAMIVRMLRQPRCLAIPGRKENNAAPDDIRRKSISSGTRIQSHNSHCTLHTAHCTFRTPHPTPNSTQTLTIRKKARGDSSPLFLALIGLKLSTQTNTLASASGLSRTQKRPSKLLVTLAGSSKCLTAHHATELPVHIEVPVILVARAPHIALPGALVRMTWTVACVSFPSMRGTAGRLAEIALTVKATGNLEQVGLLGAVPVSLLGAAIATKSLLATTASLEAV